MAVRIAIINTVACNGGDAAILAAIAEQMRSTIPGALLTAYDSQPDAAAQYHDWIRFDAGAYYAARGLGAWARRIRWLIAAALRGAGQRRSAARIVHRDDMRRLSRIARSRIVISTGGTYLVDTYNLKPRFFEFVGVRLLRRPLVLYSQTLGPFRSLFNRRGMHRVLRWSRRVFVRDDTSRRIALQLGADAGAVFVVPDAVFGAAHAHAPARLRAAALTTRPRVAVSVRELKPFVTGSPATRAEYEAAVAALVSFLVRERGAHVRFLSTCQGIAEYRYDDGAVAGRIAATLPEDVRPAVEVIGGYHSPQDLMAEFAQHDAVIATRMHAAILALCAGTPVLPIPYERKIQELFRELEVPFELVAATAASGATLIDSWCEFELTLPEWRETLAARIEAMRAAARSPAAEVARLLREIPLPG
ncbi:MAG TPA: polysaccharide pyruvyl transferase family protein [Longimicrobiales bacterium]